MHSMKYSPSKSGKKDYHYKNHVSHNNYDSLASISWSSDIPNVWRVDLDYKSGLDCHGKLTNFELCSVRNVANEICTTGEVFEYFAYTFITVFYCCASVILFALC